MADVLLTHSYHLPYDRKQVLKQQPYPPLGTLYAASLLRKNGISVSAFDTMLNDPGEGFAEAVRAPSRAPSSSAGRNDSTCSALARSNASSGPTRRSVSSSAARH